MAIFQTMFRRILFSYKLVGIFQTRICVNIVKANEILYLKSRL